MLNLVTSGLCVSRQIVFVSIVSFPVIKLLSKSTLEGTDWLKYGIYLITISLGGMIGVQLDTRKKTSNKHK